LDPIQKFVVAMRAYEFVFGIGLVIGVVVGWLAGRLGTGKRNEAEIKLPGAGPDHGTALGAPPDVVPENPTPDP